MSEQDDATSPQALAEAMYKLIPIGKRPKGTHVCEWKASPVAPVKNLAKSQIFFRFMLAELKKKGDDRIIRLITVIFQS